MNYWQISGLFPFSHVSSLQKFFHGKYTRRKKTISWKTELWKKPNRDQYTYVDICIVFSIGNMSIDAVCCWVIKCSGNGTLHLKWHHAKGSLITDALKLQEKRDILEILDNIKAWKGGSRRIPIALEFRVKKSSGDNRDLATLP